MIRDKINYKIKYHRIKATEKKRIKHIEKIRKKLKNTTMSLIASNCNGGTILHDLGVQYRSPFVNLWMLPSDYVKMLGNLKEYLGKKLEFIDVNGIEYPVAMLGDVKLFFQHYNSKEEAEQKWNERLKRINYNNLFILFTDRDGCTEQDMQDFDKLYKNKVIFVNKPHPEILSAVYIKGFEKDTSVGMCMAYRSEYSVLKYYDQFDYVSWFNKGTAY